MNRLLEHQALGFAVNAVSRGEDAILKQVHLVLADDLRWFVFELILRFQFPISKSNNNRLLLLCLVQLLLLASKNVNDYTNLRPQTGLARRYYWCGSSV